MPGIAFVNTALRDFEGKEVFSWHLSVMIQFKDLIENGMPSKKERKVVEKFEDKLNKLIKGKDKKKPNALFLSRITWKSTRELIWRVFDPEVADKVLKMIIEKKRYPRPFDYRMEDDDDWKLAEWHLKEHDNSDNQT
jgi:hypothetical protein